MTGTDPEYHVPLQFPLDGNNGPAPRITRERSAAMLSAALLEFDQLAGPGVQARPRPRVKPWIAAAGAVLVVAGSAAAYYLYAADPAPVRAPAQPVTASPLPTEISVAPDVTTEEPVAPTEASAPDAPVSEKPSRAAVRGAPEDLLQKANQQRAAGHFRDAAQTYAQVYERFPKTLSAYVAFVAGGSIEAEHLSNPTHARKLFESALRARPNGALDLEARQGLSTTLRDLEDRPAERKALQALIAAHPDSPAARRAQVRLREIGAE